MITVPEVVEKLIKNQPFIEEGLREGIINFSALARRLQPEIKRELLKDVQEGAIIMALKRMTHKNKRIISPLKRAFKEKPELIVRSNLCDITVHSNDFTADKHRKILEHLNPNKEAFLSISQSVFETTIFASRELKKPILKLFDPKKIVADFNQLSSITIRLTKETTTIPGVYYFILKALAWEGINLMDLVSTYTELTIVLEEKDIDKAFTVIKGLFA